MWVALLRKYWLPLLLTFVMLAGMAAAYKKGKAVGRAAVQARWDKECVANARAVAAAKERDTKAANVASVEYQERKAEDAAKIKVVRQTVVRTVSGPCLDADGLRHINAAIGAVPAASAAH